MLTPPPLVKAETTSRSPSTWLPVHGVLPPADAQSASSWRNQKATFASPVLAFRSRAKYRIWSPFPAVNAAAYAFMTSSLLSRLLAVEHCHPGVMFSVSLLPVAKVVPSDVSNEPFVFMLKSL